MMSKHTFKTAGMVILFAALCFAIAACSPDPLYIRVAFIEGVPETGVAGSPLLLTAKVRPVFARNSDITWLVRDAGTTGASISGNILNTRSDGTVIIRAIIANGMAEGKDYTQDFIIVFSGGSGGGNENAAVTGVTLNHSTLELNIGGTYTLIATVAPSNATNKNVTWTSNDEIIASVNNGVITAIAAGNTVITVTTEDGNFTAVCTVTVVQSGAPVYVDGVSLDQSTLTMTVGETATLIATVHPSNAANKTVTWSSNEEGVATVINGVVTAHAAGSAIITVTTVDGGITAECSVDVNNPSLLTLSGNITISPNSGVTVGMEMTAVYSGSESVTYQWEKDGISVGENSNKYTPTETGSYTVTVSLTGYNNKTSAAVVVSAAGGGSIISTTGIEMVSIPAGTFIMGSPTTEPNRSDNETQHSVTLSAFSMSKYQVTQAQYQAVMGTNPSYFDGGSSREPNVGETQGKRPVEQVSWYGALVFCNKLSEMEGLSPAYSIKGSTDTTTWGTVPTVSNSDWNAVEIVVGSNGYRLPTEAQWEYACRAGTTTVYNTGDTISDNTGWYRDNSGNKTHEVGLKPANAWGLYDMHGNVWEWCWDWYSSSYYSSSPTNDPMGASSGTYRVVRGGGWSNSAEDLRSAYRSGSDPYYWYFILGFRLIRP